MRRKLYLECVLYLVTSAYLRGGGSWGSKPPTPEFSDFFLKSEGKEIERKRKKRDAGGGGGGYLLTYFWGLYFFEWG